MTEFADIPKEVKVLFINLNNAIKWRLVSKELNHCSAIMFAHKRSHITGRDILEYALQPKHDFAIKIRSDIIYFNALGYAIYKQRCDGSIRRYGYNKVDLRVILNQDYTIFIDAITNEDGYITITNELIYDKTLYEIGFYELKSPFDIDLLSKNIILRNKGYDNLIHDYTKTYTRMYLRRNLLDMYTPLKYKNYLMLVASARMYGLCSVEYTNDEINVNNHDKLVYRMLETILKI